MKHTYLHNMDLSKLLNYTITLYILLLNKRIPVVKKGIFKIKNLLRIIEKTNSYLETNDLIVTFRYLFLNKALLKISNVYITLNHDE